MRVSPERRTTAGNRAYPGSNAQMRASAPRSDEYRGPGESNSMAWSQGDWGAGQPRGGDYADEFESRPAPEPYSAGGLPWFRQPALYLVTGALAATLAGGGLAYSLTSNGNDSVPPKPDTIAPLAPQQFSPPPAPVLAPPNPVAPPVEITVPAPNSGGSPGVNSSPGTRSGGGSVDTPRNGPRVTLSPPAGAATPGAPPPPVAPPLPVAPIPEGRLPVFPPNAGQPVPPKGGEEEKLPPAGGGQEPEKVCVGPICLDRLTGQQPPAGGGQLPPDGGEEQVPVGGGQAPDPAPVDPPQGFPAPANPPPGLPGGPVLIPLPGQPGSPI